MVQRARQRDEQKQQPTVAGEYQQQSQEDQRPNRNRSVPSSRQRPAGTAPRRLYQRSREQGREAAGQIGEDGLQVGERPCGRSLPGPLLELSHLQATLAEVLAERALRPFALGGADPHLRPLVHDVHGTHLRDRRHRTVHIPDLTDESGVQEPAAVRQTPATRSGLVGAGHPGAGADRDCVPGIDGNDQAEQRGDLVGRELGGDRLVGSAGTWAPATSVTASVNASAARSRA